MKDERPDEKTRVARAFLRGKNSYDRQAIAQRAVNERLLGLLKAACPFGRVLEIGCCTGMLTELACRLLQPEVYYVNDLVPEFYESVRERLDDSLRRCLQPCFGDVEQCELPGKLDLVLSSSTLQWLADLGLFFARAADALRDRGRLVFSMFGQETMSELTELTGVGLRYPSFAVVSEQLDSRFRIISGETVRDQLFFPTPYDVLRHIKATGVGGIGGYVWTPRRVERFAERYRQRFSGTDGVVLSYVSYIFVAEKRS